MKLIAPAFFVLTSGILTNAASAADPHLDDLAFSLRQQAALACQEVRYGFQRSPTFPHLYKDFYNLYSLAEHVHDVAHNSGDLRHLKDDADEIDASFHHAQEMLAQFGAARPVPVRHGCICQTPAPAGVSGFHLRRLQVLVGQMETTIHHLQEDLDAEIGPSGVAPPLPPSQVSPGVPALSPSNLPPTYNTPANPGTRGLPPLPSQYPSQSGVNYRIRPGQVAFSIRIGG